MGLHLSGIRIDATDPRAVARFWAGVLHGDVHATDPGSVVVGLPDEEYVLRFVATPHPKTGRNRLHLDLTSRSSEDQEEIVVRAIELGGAHHDVGQRGDEGHVVLADPDRNELCVIEPGNRFLAGCGSIGAVNCDGNRVTGEFWRDALGWPLVWDDGEETAVQSPAGGSKITWSGPPLFDKPPTGRNRIRFEVTTDDGVDAEADRLVALGAALVEAVPDRFGTLLLTDPDDNEFHLGGA
ncbi:Glyoxalase/bleomycin resistance protein/dioxygenase [Xylanimonas cellulosilytica DSM 15894]|uniref:Glyoxalase/bleomycin resistance protein/dioxygenase n=1 Tax=Xylanimonas cellulosilytica (strain DSM 15894 / JCM 12276 / CECT 5975 / KCTC 9989 / LMG 20990 / NBRC 107835 / XIL07) TaxID=446471 RepID=D1BZJ3_XYLCX|nr:VOC family protein [Xylanimonas cellulosilytica]ACZ30147.1 Glyoxalase/bleomycin resistance protein/dioxygenase [Xylanimonas cellulosilytica DSM 15894]